MQTPLLQTREAFVDVSDMERIFPSRLFSDERRFELFAPIKATVAPVEEAEAGVVGVPVPLRIPGPRKLTGSELCLAIGD